jgi:polysaccharide export outer membrane protein
MMRRFTAVLARILRFALVGCQFGALCVPVAFSQPVTPSGTATESASAAPGPDYRLGPEDVIEISVWKEEGLRKDLLVRPDGMVTFALAGEIPVAGRTADEVRADVTERLKRFLSNPVVSVTVLKVAAQKIYVIGRVNKPGEFASGRYIDVLQALSMAGGLTPFAAPDDIRVMRRSGAKQIAIPFRYSEVIRGRNVEQNIILKPGDVVVVP